MHSISPYRHVAFRTRCIFIRLASIDPLALFALDLLLPPLNPFPAPEYCHEWGLLSAPTDRDRTVQERHR